MTTARKTAATKPTPKADDSEETTPKVNTFTYKDTEYAVPADPLDLPFEVALAETESEVIQEIVGPDQWVAFRKTRPTMRQFGDFSELVLNACGYGDPGN
ncbi:hypothetical protein OG306_33170 [Streptomyces sp. NBC_01241]|uniref:hypothetical protein n=1 Tax=Streptomyces sp. NBC_01241 TaxID=2903794 RepID=UPI00352E1B2E|nr:hypothetical protein OG306_33170 [Streptomyces sp. NBC_01241]